MSNPHSTPKAAEAARHQILRCTVGSKVLGLNLPGTDDLDLMGICLEPPEYVVGLRPFEQWISRTKANGEPQPEGHRSGPGDTDLVVYSARKWCRLALSGNPTVLLPLFVPWEETQVLTLAGAALRNLAPAFASRRAGRAFLGYMTQQRERMMGTRGGKHTNRPELIEKYGYDVKYAYHMLRLGMQGIEYLQTGRITLPMPENEREWLLSVRQGGETLEYVLEAATAYEGQVKGLLTSSPLPEHPDEVAVERWLLSTYADAWDERRVFMPGTGRVPYTPSTWRTTMSDTTINQPEQVTEQPASDGAVQVNEPQGDVTVNTGGQEATTAPGGAPTGPEEAKTPGGTGEAK